MVPDLTLETIYFNTPTDFKMEFSLCGICNVRYLSASVTDKKSFLHALKKSVSRSRVIIAVGGFNSKDNLPKTISKAVGLSLSESESAAVKNIFSEGLIPNGAIPLINPNDILCGLVLETENQSIIMLTENKENRFEIVERLVLP